MTEERRNYGIDLLRIVSMNMIVMLHVLGNGSFLDNVEGITIEYATMWFLETASLCAVNCFALISGYVGFGRKFKLSKLMQLWIEVVFYLLLFRVIYYMIDPMSVKSMPKITTFFPVLSDTYWYFTAYFVMFLFTPYLNDLIEKLNFEKNSLLVFLFFTVFSVMLTLSRMKPYDLGVNPPTRSGYSMFGLNSGYSPLWLMILYYLGAYIKKYRIAEKIKPKASVIVYFGCVILSLVSKLRLTSIYDRTGKYQPMISFLVEYYSPTILSASVALLVLFAHFRFHRKTAAGIRFFSSSAFGVYIIHLQRNNLLLLRDSLSRYVPVNLPRSVLFVILTVLVIWLVCSLIDKFRQLLFTVFRIPLLSEKADSLLRKIIKKLFLCYQKKIAVEE